MIKLYNIVSSRRTALILFMAGCMGLLFADYNLLSADVDTVDLYEPQVSVTKHCGDFVITVVDNRTFHHNDDTVHVDSGILEQPVLLPTWSENISEIFASTFNKNEINFDFSFRLSVLNKYKDAKAFFYVIDVSGRFVFDSVVYKADRIEMAPGIIAFGYVNVGSYTELGANIRNASSHKIELKSISLKYGQRFKIYDIPDKQFIDSAEIIKFNIRYTPETDIYTGFFGDIDTLILETPCLRYTIVVMGTGVIAGIEVDDIDFGAIEVGKKAEFHESYNPAYGRGLRIGNNRTGKLIIDGYYSLNTGSPFYLSEPTVPSVYGLEINPKTGRYIKGVTFEPLQAGEFFDTLIFKNNAKGPDSICHVRGIAYLPGPYFNSYDFGRLRLGDRVKGEVKVKNSGNEPVEITDFRFDQSNHEFKVLIDETYPKPDKQSPVLLYPDRPEYADRIREINVAVEFSPLNEFEREVKLIPVFSEDSKFKTGSVFNYLRGYGFKPVVKATGYDFNGRTLVNIQHPDTGRIMISSESWSSNLYLKKIEVLTDGFTGLDEFKFLTNLPEDTVLTIDKSLKIPVTFLPREAGYKQLTLRIITDAYTGEESSKWDTVSVIVSGHAYNKVLSFETVEIDSVFQCSSTKFQITLKNISDTVGSFINYVREVAGDTAFFDINTDFIDNNFVRLEPGDSLNFDVNFDPTGSDKSSFELFVRVYSDADTGTGYIRINTIRHHVEVKLPKSDNLYPGDRMEYDPPFNYAPDFEISADFSNVSDININKYIIELKYKKKELKFDNKVKNGDISSDWVVLSASEIEQPGGYTLLRIISQGVNSLSGKKGILLKPVFLILLGDSVTIDINIESISFPDMDNCIVTTGEDGYLKMSYCGDEVRKIILSNNIYDFASMSGNPVTGTEAELFYSVAIEAHTYVDIIDSFGQSLFIIENQILEPGEYSSNIDVTNLSSGTYFVRIVSGPFTKTLKLMIIK